MSKERPNSIPSTVYELWDDLLEDANATAEEYRSDGWQVQLLHPGDVTPLYTDPYGLDVVIPGDEFEELERIVQDAQFDVTHVYRTDGDDARLFVILVEATDSEISVVIPAYLASDHISDLRDRADDAMYTHARPLSDDKRVTFTHEDPALFFEG